MPIKQDAGTYPGKLKLDYLPHYTGAKPETIEVSLLTFRDKEISEKFSQNFTTFLPTL
jgi:hypothetical protein